MASDQEKTQLTNSLKTTVKILNECGAKYRILGSTLVAAYVNRIFRRIGDLDLLLDNKSKKCVFQKLEKEGFQFTKQRWGVLSWDEAYKKEHLGLSILLIGDFYPDYFSYRFLAFFELRITNAYLKSTKYQFSGVTFNGIPVSSVISGIKQSFLNPKRKIDNKALGEAKKKVKVVTHNQINIFFFGIKIPYLYDVFSFFYNIYGGIRVILGKKYEAW
jgi:hypothetical protein